MAVIIPPTVVPAQPPLAPGLGPNMLGLVGPGPGIIGAVNQIIPIAPGTTVYHPTTIGAALQIPPNMAALILAASADTTVRLPINPTPGQIFTLTQIGQFANWVTLVDSGNATIDGAVNLVLRGPVGVARVQWTGSMWTTFATSPGNIWRGTFSLGAPVTVVATGSTQADAAPLSNSPNLVTGADGTKGVILPFAPVGQLIIVVNLGASPLNVYAGPVADNGTVNFGAANAAGIMAAQTAALFYCYADNIAVPLPGFPNKWVTLNGGT